MIFECPEESLREATRDELARKTGLSVRGIIWNLKKMKDKKIIKRIGPAKGGHWELVN